jgi:hypothetical protein
MNALQAAELRRQGFDVQAAAVPPLPPGPAVGVVWMSHMLEHAPTYRDARAIVAAAAERLAHGGHLVVIGPDVLSSRGGFWDSDWSHGFPTSLRRVAQLLGEAGLQVVAKRHHTLTVDGAWATVLSGLLRLVPCRLLDAALERLTGRPLAYSFMTLLGWRQIFVVGRKP